MFNTTSPFKRTALLVLTLALAVGGTAVVKSAAPLAQLIERAYFFASYGLAELAAAQLQDVIKADAANKEARLVAGMALQTSGKDEQAVEQWLQADKLGDPAAATFLGDALFVRGDLDGAEAAYKRALSRQKGAARPIIGLALTEESRGRLDAAIELIKPVAIVKEESELPPVIDAMYVLARLYLKTNHIEDSLSLLKKGVLYNPGHAGMHLVMGQAYEAKGAKAEAKHAYERSLQLSPDMRAANEGLRRLQQ